MGMKPQIDIDWGKYGQNWKNLSTEQPAKEAGRILRDVADETERVLHRTTVTPRELPSSSDCMAAYFRVFRDHIRHKIANVR